MGSQVWSKNLKSVERFSWTSRGLSWGLMASWPLVSDNPKDISVFFFFRLRLLTLPGHVFQLWHWRGKSQPAYTLGLFCKGWKNCPMNARHGDVGLIDRNTGQQQMIEVNRLALYRWMVNHQIEVSLNMYWWGRALSPSIVPVPDSESIPPG